MFATVEAVTSMSQWQLTCLMHRAFGFGWDEMAVWDAFNDLPAMSHVHMSSAYCHTMHFRQATKSINPSSVCLCVIL